jgi:hypothetical protein
VLFLFYPRRKGVSQHGEVSDLSDRHPAAGGVVRSTVALGVNGPRGWGWQDVAYVRAGLETSAFSQFSYKCP